MPTLPELVVPGETAVLVVDMQNDFCHPDGVHGRAGRDVTRTHDVVKPIISVLSAARRVGAHTVLVRTEHGPDDDSPAWLVRGGSRPAGASVRTGSWGAGYFEVRPEHCDEVMTKHRYSAFVGTGLEDRLRERGVRTVVVVGVLSVGCVESTVRDACMRDFYVVVPRDCCEAYDEAEHRFSLRNMGASFARLCDAPDLVEIWDPDRRPGKDGV